MSSAITRSILSPPVVCRLSGSPRQSKAVDDSLVELKVFYIRIQVPGADPALARPNLQRADSSGTFCAGLVYLGTRLDLCRGLYAGLFRLPLSGRRLCSYRLCSDCRELADRCTPACCAHGALGNTRLDSRVPDGRRFPRDGSTARPGDDWKETPFGLPERASCRDDAARGF